MLKRLTLSLLASLALSGATLAATGTGPKTLFRYKDENGVTVVNNILPPEVVSRGYSIVNKQGQVLEVVPPAKTKAELAADKQATQKARELEAQRKAAKKRDQTLLNSFSAMDDITRARDNQLGAIDVTISVAEGNISRVKGQLESQQQKAADIERSGKAIPVPITRDIEDSLRQIKESQRFIADKRAEQDRLRQRFEADIVRFQELHAERLVRASERGQSLPMGLAHGTYACQGAEQCDKVWALAQLYARENATTRLEIITDTIILTSEPKTDRDVALSISRVPGADDKEQIVVEIRCTKSEAGTAQCQSSEVAALPSGFAAYVDSRLKP